jgi:hypothetical protein
MSSGVEGSAGSLPPIGNGSEPLAGATADFDLSIRHARDGQGVRYAFDDTRRTQTPSRTMPDTLPGSPNSGRQNLLRGLQRLGPLLGIGAAGYVIGDKAGQWYFGQEVAIAKRIGERVGVGQVSPFSEQGNVIGTHLGFPGIGGQAQIDYANNLLSLKAGKASDFRTMDTNALADLLEAPWPNAAQLRENSTRLKARASTAGPQANGGDPDPAAKPDAKPDQPAGPGELKEGFLFETRNREEADLVAVMHAQGKSQYEIQVALDNLRANRGGSTAPGSGIGGTTTAPPNSIDAAINAALNSADPERRLEGEVAKALKDAGFNVTDFNTKIGPNGSIGEIDVATDQVIIEVTTRPRGKLSQIKRSITDEQMNPADKRVILYAPNYQHRAERDITEAGSEVVRSLPDLLKRMRELSGN